ncbi:hypothetical protein H5410_037088 [Solanum commersonii]|uniref:Uncharacterized protein n=1 Tax=Solanum commersonii TaxID=4109 RepID=A0A9J5Y8H9_SOLCO|nr:hypothetical protein H5410_037088 [Solanum commersonii]
MEILPSPLSPIYRFQLDSIYENFVRNLAVISETRGEASFEWGSVRRPFGGEKIRYRELEHAWSAFRSAMVTRTEKSDMEAAPIGMEAARPPAVGRDQQLRATFLSFAAARASSAVAMVAWRGAGQG